MKGGSNRCKAVLYLRNRIMNDFEFVNEFIKSFETKFNVNKELRTITCIMTTKEDFVSRLIRFGFAEEFYKLPFELRDLREDDLDVCKYVGIAVCNPDDEWDEEYGKQLAEYRAACLRRNDINEKINNFVYRMNVRLDNLEDYGKLRRPKHPDER